MADLGETSTANSSAAAGGPGHKASSWAVVGLITVAAVVLAFAFVLRNVPLAIVGGLVLLVGLVVGWVGGIMDDVH